MKRFILDDMVKGWFIGNFKPSILKTDSFEVAIKRYKKGDCEDAHFHKQAKEITAVIKGKISLNDKIFNEGDIIVIETNEIVKFCALEDSINVVVKTPSVSNDKFIVNK